MKPLPAYAFTMHANDVNSKVTGIKIFNDVNIYNTFVWNKYIISYSNFWRVIPIGIMLILKVEHILEI